jgi:Putative peptidoglycan binding domain
MGGLLFGDNTDIFFQRIAESISVEVISLKLFKEETRKMSSALWKGFLAIAIIVPTLTIASKALAELRLGDRGRAVEDLQAKLDIPADGVFGAQTEVAVMDFQRLNGLVDDGIAGRATLSTLGLDPDSQGDGSFQTSSAASGSGPYRVVVPGNDSEMLSRTRRVVTGAEFANDSERGDFIDAGGYDSRSTARDVAQELQDLNLDARVDFKD